MFYEKDDGGLDGFVTGGLGDFVWGNTPVAAAAAPQYRRNESTLPKAEQLEIAIAMEEFEEIRVLLKEVNIAELEVMQHLLNKVKAYSLPKEALRKIQRNIEKILTLVRGKTGEEEKGEGSVVDVKCNALRTSYAEIKEAAPGASVNKEAEKWVSVFSFAVAVLEEQTRAKAQQEERPAGLEEEEEEDALMRAAIALSLQEEGNGEGEDPDVARAIALSLDPKAAVDAKTEEGEQTTFVLAELCMITLLATDEDMLLQPTYRQTPALVQMVAYIKNLTQQLEEKLGKEQAFLQIEEYAHTQYNRNDVEHIIEALRLLNRPAMTASPATHATQPLFSIPEHLIYNTFMPGIGPTFVPDTDASHIEPLTLPPPHMPPAATRPIEEKEGEREEKKERQDPRKNALQQALDWCKFEIEEIHAAGETCPTALLTQQQSLERQLRAPSGQGIAFFTAPSAQNKPVGNRLPQNEPDGPH